MVKFVLVDAAKQKDEAVYRAAIDQLCPGKDFCALLFWSDPARVPTALPMSDDSVQSQIAAYNRNPTTGLDELLWSCRIKNDAASCFSE